MSGRSGFFKQMAEGAMGQYVKMNDEEKAKKDKIDAYRAQKLEDVNAQDTINKREFERKSEEDRRKAKAAQERAAEELQGFMNSSSGKTRTPFEMGQFHTARAAALKTAGLDDESGAAKISADFYQQDIANSDRLRTQAKAGFTSVDGINPSAELIKEDTAIYQKGEIPSGMYQKYRGVTKDISMAQNDPDTIKSIEELKKDTALAARVTQGLTQITADENGISEYSSGELKQDGIQLVQYKNILENPDLVESHQDAIEGTKKLLESYPNGEVIYSKMGFDVLEDRFNAVKESAVEIKTGSDATTAAPVELTPATPAPKGTVSTEKPATQNLITVNSKAAYEQLPKGATFYTPDGKKRIKP